MEIMNLEPHISKPGTPNNRVFSWIVRNTHNPVRCKIGAMLHIIRRFVSLVGERYDLPLSIYRGPTTGTIQNFDSNIIRIFLREAAAAVYHITPDTPEGKTTLARWSSHSFRIGSCVILYATGFTDTQIKHILRWKSDSFRHYLRNLAIIVSRQNDAIDDLATVPNLIYEGTTHHSSSLFNFLLSFLSFSDCPSYPTDTAGHITLTQINIFYI
jgi:hypothetical protein